LEAAAAELRAGRNGVWLSGTPCADRRECIKVIERLKGDRASVKITDPFD